MRLPVFIKKPLFNHHLTVMRRLGPWIGTDAVNQLCGIPIDIDNVSEGYLEGGNVAINTLSMCVARSFIVEVLNSAYLNKDRAVAICHDLDDGNYVTQLTGVDPATVDEFETINLIKECELEPHSFTDDDKRERAQSIMTRYYDDNPYRQRYKRYIKTRDRLNVAFDCHRAIILAPNGFARGMDMANYLNGRPTSEKDIEQWNQRHRAYIRSTVVKLEDSFKPILEKEVDVGSDYVQYAVDLLCPPKYECRIAGQKYK